MGLANDPEHIGCVNLRAMALTKLGRTDDAGSATALARNPLDAFSHANQGWNLLQSGKRKEALEHFREALRLEPEMDFARAGIVEAMKSKNWFYALMLRYFLWMEGLSNGARWAVVLGGYVGYRILLEVAQTNPKLMPWIVPILVAYVIFVLMTWIARPLSSLVLRFDRFGRQALSRDQVIASNCVACFFFPALILVVVWLFTESDLALLAAAFFGFLLLPVSGIFNSPPGWPRRMMIYYTAALAIIGLSWLPLVLAGEIENSRIALQVFLWGSFLSGFVANFLVMQSPRM